MFTNRKHASLRVGAGVLIALALMTLSPPSDIRAGDPPPPAPRKGHPSQIAPTPRENLLDAPVESRIMDGEQKLSGHVIPFIRTAHKVGALALEHPVNVVIG